MSRRRERGSPISLFFFQDIITCVSGVMILLMLLFALSAPDDIVPQTNGKVEVTRLQDRSDEITHLRGRLSTLRRLESAYGYVSELAHLHEKAAKSAEDFAIQESEVRKVLLEMAQLDESIQQAQVRLTTAQQSLDASKKARAVRFIPQGRTEKTPVFVECSEDGMRCGIAGSGLPPLDFSFDALPPFFEHVGRFTPASHFFVFFIKPSAPTKQVLGIIDLVQLSEFDVGFDALEDENTVDFGGRR